MLDASIFSRFQHVSVAQLICLLTYLSQMDLPTLISRTSPFQILGVFCGIFLFLFFKFQ